MVLPFVEREFTSTIHARMSETWAGRRLHFIGIGGAGMSGLALVTRALGAAVTGSDRAASSYSERLRSHGIEPAIGHDAANVPDDAEVVVSTAISESNPELAIARERGQRVLHRGDLLAEASTLKRCIAVSGTHGKTTTSAMVAHVLVETGRDPGYLIGGELRSTGSNAAWGAGEWIVVEADESDRSFLKVEPEVAVVTNIEVDHHGTYTGQLDVERAFEGWVESAGITIAWEQTSIAPQADVTYGIGGGDLRADDVVLDSSGARFTVDGVPVELGLFGAHNVLNALAALGASRAAGAPLAEAAAALASFRGAKRRFESRGTTSSGAAIVDDYAHHPTEVAATLDAARTTGARRLIAIFQPHLYSRTQHLQREFGRALSLADVVVVVDIFPAREDAADYPGVTGHLIARSAADAAAGRPVYWLPKMDDAERIVNGIAGEGDLVMTLGAGDVDKLAAALAV
jgi:UDP-N-acetylmuramate--alanine ligase